MEPALAASPSTSVTSTLDGRTGSSDQPDGIFPENAQPEEPEELDPDAQREQEEELTEEQEKEIGAWIRRERFGDPFQP